MSVELRDLINGMLRKDPASRLTLKEIRRHPWLTMDMGGGDGLGKTPAVSLTPEKDNCHLVTVTDEEMKLGVTSIPKLHTLVSYMHASHLCFFVLDFRLVKKSFKSWLKSSNVKLI